MAHDYNKDTGETFSEGSDISLKQEEAGDHQAIKEFVDQLDPDELSFLCSYAEEKQNGGKQDEPSSFDEAMKNYD